MTGHTAKLPFIEIPNKNARDTSYVTIYTSGFCGTIFRWL